MCEALAVRRQAWVMAVLLAACGGDDAVPADAGEEPDAGARDAGGEADAGPSGGDAGGADPCVGGPAFHGEQRLMLEHEGRVREYLLHVPDAVNASAAPLVVNFHAYLFDAEQQASYSRMREAADARGWIVAHPEGIGGSWNAEACCGTAEREMIDDLGFATALLAEIEARVCVDARRTYAMGFSNGGFFSHRLACTMSARFAAIGTVAGPDGTSACDPAEPVGVLHIHGSSDLIVAYDGGLFPRGAMETFEAWGMRNGCTGAPAESFANGDARCVAFPACANGVTTELCTIDGGGHTWPGATETISPGHMSMDLDATERILELFARHSR